MTTRRSITTLLLVGLLGASGSAARASTIVQYTFENNLPSATTLDPHLDTSVVTDISLGAGMTTPIEIANSYGYATGYVLRLLTKDAPTSTALAVASNDYAGFTVQPAAGYVLNLSSLEFDAAKGGSSNTRGLGVQTSVDGLGSGGSILADQVLNTVRPNWTHVSIDLSAAKYQGLTGPQSFRIFMYSGDAGKSEEFDNITLNGTAAPVPEPSTCVLLLCGLLGLTAVWARCRRGD